MLILVITFLSSASQPTVVRRHRGKPEFWSPGPKSITLLAPELTPVTLLHSRETRHISAQTATSTVHSLDILKAKLTLLCSAARSFSHRLAATLSLASPLTSNVHTWHHIRWIFPEKRGRVFHIKSSLQAHRGNPESSGRSHFLG